MTSSCIPRKSFFVFLPSTTKLRRLCFYRRVSVHGGGVPDQVHPPLGPGTPLKPGTPPGPVHPLGRYTPRAGTPPGQVHPLGRYTPQDMVHPPGQVHPPGPGTPPTKPSTPPDQVHPLEIRPLLRTVRILLECILVK